MNHYQTLLKTFLSTAITFFSLQAFAGPGALVNSPLFVNATAASNIMFLVDNSRSMAHVAEESDATNANKYNSATTYNSTCAAPVAGSQNVFVYIDSNVTKLRFSHDGSTDGGKKYTANYSNAETTGNNGNICFDSTTIYKAGLNANDASNIRPEFNFTAKYTGNYLNWYFKFDNTTPNWSSGQTIKPGTQTRQVIAKDSLTTLVQALDTSDVQLRLGLTVFNSAGTGALILDEIKTLDSTQSASIVANLAIIGPAQTHIGGGTPLAESLHQIGRYFIGETGTAVGATLQGNLDSNLGTTTSNSTNGNWNGDLILHPDGTNVVVDDDLAFNVSPTYASGAAQRSSPIQYWCQNNFAVAMTDGLPTADQTIPSYFSDYDSDCVGASPACSTFDRKDSSLGYSYELNIFSPSDYFDDVAQALFEIDLRPDINDFDGTAVKNNIITYTIAFADQDALTNKLISDAGTQGGGEAITAADGQDLIAKFTDVTTKILATTSSAAAVTFNTITLGSDTAVYQALFSTSFWNGEINSFPIDPSNGNITTTCTLDVDANCWKASTHIDNLAYNSGTSTFLDNRQIITFNTTIQKGIAFTPPVAFETPVSGTEITTAMISDLCAGPDVPTPTVPFTNCDAADTAKIAENQLYIERAVNYIRGDRTYEEITTTPTFRTRESVLGDIINAAPVFVANPNFNWPTVDNATNNFGEGFPALPLASGKRYSDYQLAQAGRTKVLYASANDGMLHAFRTETKATPGTGDYAGDELFAFIPSFVFSNSATQGLHYLADPGYRHKYYLDLSPTISDVYVKGKDSSNSPTFATAAAAWRTVLIGGSRGGEKIGLFALDISDPETVTEATAADKVLWEFTNADDTDLGHTYSKPTIALTNGTDGAGLRRWAAIFGNGYQNDSSAVSNGSSCTAQLFIVFLDGGLDGVWTEGTDPDTADYIKIDTEIGTTAAGDCNGLSTPALADTNGDRIVDRVYAGDIKGNMWAFDLTCTGSCGAGEYDVAYKTGPTPKPLFTAIDENGVIQPITVRPNLATNTAQPAGSAPNIMVLFGTGQYLTAGDSTGSANIHAFYGVWDEGTKELAVDHVTAANSDLVEQVLTTTTTAFGDIRTITAAAIDWSTKHGWYINLDGQGTSDAEERVVVDPVIRSNIVFFNTLIPNSQVCGFGGSGFLMSVDFTTGAATTETIFDVNGNNVIDPGDNISGEVAVGTKIDSIPASSNFSGNYRYTSNSGAGTEKDLTNVAKGLREGRLSWRELREAD